MPPQTVQQMHLLLKDDAEHEAFYADVRKHPVAWVRMWFGVKLWKGPDGRPGQAEVVQSVFQNQRTVVPAGHAVGKTQAIRFIVPLWLISHPGSYVIMTGASWDAVKLKLIPGVRSEIVKQPGIFPGNVQANVWMWGDEYGLIGISPIHDEPAQGWHSRGGTLVIADEASGLQPNVYTALESLLVGAEDHIVMLGNPLRSDGPFADAIRNPALWNVIQLSSLDSPNVRAGRIVVNGLATVEQVKGFALEYGEDSVEYGIRVLGQLPDQSEMIYISRAAVLACGDRAPVPWQEDGDLILGIDIAWSEVGDESVFLVRGDTTIHHAEAHRGLTEPQLIGITKIIWRQFEGKIRHIKPDATGIGSGAADTLLAEGFPVVRIVNSARANNAIKYANTRAESWGAMKDALQHLSIPKTLNGIRVLDKLLQMATLEYRPTARGQILIEPKPQYKDRTGKESPDWPDALALTYARYTGRPAFPMLSPHHCMDLRPTVYAYREGWNLHIESYPASDDRPGYLARAAWFSNSGASAALTVHVDTDGAWTVVDSYRVRAPSIDVFWRATQSLCAGRDYAFDIASAAEYAQGRYQHHLVNTLQEIDPEYGPVWIEPARIGGMHGIERLDQMLLAGLASDPDAAYWSDHPEIDPREQHSERVLAIYPREVYTALEQARLKEPPVTQTDPESQAPEGLVGDGSALVKCLRLLAVSGAAY